VSKLWFTTGGEVEAPRGSELILGDYRTVLAGDWMWDALIFDPPYGAKTHDSDPQRTDTMRDPGKVGDGIRPMYEKWTPADVAECVQFTAPRTRGWMVALTSHDLIPAWQNNYERAGRYAFAPVACVINGMSIRLAGDGPSSWTIYAMVSRPKTREMATWGTLPGAYVGNRSSDSGGGRGKPQWLMSALVRDYTRPNDLVVDPCAGWGATLQAALALGRRAVGCDIDPVALEEARRRIARPLQTDMFA
jgi:hypothetical protein